MSRGPSEATVSYFSTAGSVLKHISYLYIHPASSVYLFNITLNAILLFEILQIRRIPDEHHFLELSRMYVLESRHLFAVADAAFQDRFLGLLIISLCHLISGFLSCIFSE